MQRPCRPRPERRRPRRRAALVLALVLPLAVPGLTGSGAAATAPVAAPPGAGPAGTSARPTPSPVPVAPPVDAETPVQVEVTGLAPRALVSPDQPVQVTGRLANRGEVPVTDLSVQLLVGDRIISRSALAREDADPGTGRASGAETEPGQDELAGGEATTFDLRATVEDLRLRQVGVYPLQVQVRGRLGDARSEGDVGLATTFVPWFPDGPPSPTRIAFLWPLVAEPARAPDGALLGTDLVDELDDGGRLDRLLAAAARGAPGACDEPAEPEQDTATAPGAGPPADRAAPPPVPAPACRATPVPVTYGVDPDLLETAQVLAGEHAVQAPGGARTVEPGEPAAARWLARLQAALGDRPAGDDGAAVPGDLLALPFGDPDVVATTRSRTGLTSDTEQLQVLGRQVAAALTGAEPLEDLAWPPPGPLTAGVLDALSSSGTRAVVLDPEALPERTSGLDRTPGARTPLTATVGGPLAGLVVDAGLSQLLTAGPDDPGWQGARLAEQRWLVETAVLAAERPGESRTLLVAPPRRAQVRPEVAGEALLDAGRLPWLCPVPLEAVAGGTERCSLEAPDAPADRVEDRGALEPADGEGELSPMFLQQVAAVRGLATQLTDEVLLPGTEQTVQIKARLLRARGRTLSSAWRSEPLRGRQMLELQREEVDRLRSQVQLITSGRALLTSDTGVVRVELSNSLDQPVTVGVALNDPVEARLTSSDTAVQTVGPGQQVQVLVRVEARVSGQFVVRATLLDRAGQPFGEPVELIARSTRYGRLALAVTGVAAGVLLVAVGVRLVRRALGSTSAGATPDGP